MSASPAAIRRYVLTGSVAAITATGAWYGAGLKTQSERNQERQAMVEASPEEQIKQMEAFREILVKRQHELQTKIDRLDAKAVATPPAPRGR